jgi:two-component system phosphate regulon response regulator PhoB
MKTIVVADDEDFLRLLVKETLNRYRVIEARDGDEAIALVRESAPDLLILDWMMPGRNGPAVLETLRADPATRDLPVLMVTARLETAERAQLLAAGATACLAKPFGTAALRASVEEVLAKSAEPTF